MRQTSALNARSEDPSLDFMWIELTNRCNLECSHCYTNSSPTVWDISPLTLKEYESVLRGAKTEGCTSVQFIGGEPTLNKMLPQLIQLSDEIGYETIEIFTNLVSIPDRLLEVFKECQVDIATSVYSKDPTSHDIVTSRPGSWSRTLKNIKKVQKNELKLRVSVIEMETNSGHVEETVSWLHSLGIENVGIDRVREFGRAEVNGICDQGELCGECSHGKVCISPDGLVSPCIMSKAWSVGSLKTQSFQEIVRSSKLKSTRQSIYANTLAKSMGGCNPDRKNPCGPDQGGPCNPCNPNGHCGPNSCQPVR